MYFVFKDKKDINLLDFWKRTEYVKIVLCSSQAPSAKIVKLAVALNISEYIWMYNCILVYVWVDKNLLWAFKKIGNSKTRMLIAEMKQTILKYSCTSLYLSIFVL